MKICFLAAANSAHSHRWIRFFAAHGHEVHWISLTASEGPIPDGVRFYRVGGGAPGRLRLLAAVPRVLSLVRRLRPDVLHAHYAGSYGLLGMLTRWHPYVVTAWGSDILFTGQAPVTGPIVRRVLASADLITCDAYHLMGAMRRLGAEPSKIKVVFFGMETDRFSPGPADAEFSSRWDAAGRPVVISLRSLEPVYDIETLIDAVPHVVREHPNVRVVIAGSGSRAPALNNQAKALGVADNIAFTGRYDNSDLPRMLRTADVYVSTALSDAGLAASTAEAMSCGVPVVISDTAENREWVHDGENGFIVPPRDPRSLAAQIVHLLDDASLRETMGKLGRETIVTRDDYARQMQIIDDYYVELAARRTRRA